MSHAMICPWWLAYTFDHPLRRLVHRPRTLYGAYVCEGMTVCDLGCGLGFNTMGLAELVGPNGRVIAVDIQDKMLQGVMRRAARGGLENRVTCRLAEPHRLGLAEEIDFALAFWMLHELPEPSRLLVEVARHLRPSGRLMIVEPRLHVTARTYGRMVEQAEEAGLGLVNEPRVFFSRAAVFQRI